MAQVKFTTFGSNTAIGGFAPGDTLRCSEEMAKHFVDEIGCAERVDGDGKSTTEAQSGKPAAGRRKEPEKKA